MAFRLGVSGQEHKSLIREAEDAYEGHRMDELPVGLRRNSLNHYYLSVYPGLLEMSPLEELPEPLGKASSMYVHVPFCSRICDFCSYFVRNARGNEDLFANYFKLLGQEFDNHLNQTTVRLGSIYFGGGTPSLTPPEVLGTFLEHLRSRGALDENVLGTVELHPEFFDDSARPQEFFNVMRRFGLRRVSIGYQSSNEGILRETNRGHNTGFLQKAVDFIRRNGFRFNVDLIYGFPGLTFNDWAMSLDDVLIMSPDSVSPYFLFLDERTKMRHDVKEGRLSLPSHREIQVQHLMAQIALERNGYFELPGDFFAKPVSGFNSATAVQTRLPSTSTSLSLGAGSYGFSNRTQFYNQFNLERYASIVEAGGIPVWMGSVMDDETLLRRDIMFSLKNEPHLRRGLFVGRYGVDPFIKFSSEMEKLAELGLLTISDEAVSLTSKGRLVVEEMACQFKDPRVLRRLADGVSLPLLERHNFSPEYPKIISDD